MGAPFLYESSRWPPGLYFKHPLDPRKRNPNGYVWVKSSFTLGHNMSWGFLLCYTPTAWGTVCQPNMQRCRIRLLCPARRLVTTLGCVMLKESSPFLAVRLGPKINIRSSLWALVRTPHIAMCRLSILRAFYILYLISCLETPKAISIPTNQWTALCLVLSGLWVFIVS